MSGVDGNPDPVHVVFNDEDLVFEEEILRNPYRWVPKSTEVLYKNHFVLLFAWLCFYSLKSWLRYIDARIDAEPHVINMIYERAVKQLPGSYKLWYFYLRIRRQQVRLIWISFQKLGSNLKIKVNFRTKVSSSSR